AKSAALQQARTTGTVQAGTEDPSGHVQVLEMLPQNFKVKSPPASVGWLAPSHNEIHTVTFPSGAGSNSVDAIPLLCEGNPDTAANSSGGPPCATPSAFEIHLNPQPQGVPVITSPSTVASSGVIGSVPGPFPPGYTFAFPNAGTFTYQCKIHDHMTGTITVGGQQDDD